MTDLDAVTTALEAVLEHSGTNAKGLMLIPEYKENLPAIRAAWQRTYGRGKDTFDKDDSGNPLCCRDKYIQRLRKLQHKLSDE